MAVVGVRERRSVSEWRKVSWQVRDEEETEENRWKNEKKKRGWNKVQKQRRNNHKENEWDWWRQKRNADTAWDTAVPRRCPHKKGGAQRPVWNKGFQQRKLWQFQHPLVLRSVDFWGPKHLQQVWAAQTLCQHNQLGFHKLIELCKQITHSQDKQSPAKTQPPLGPQEKWAWLCFC